MPDEAVDVAESPLVPTALLVDDDAGVRTYVSNVLRREGFSVVLAGDGIDALAQVKAMRGAVDVLVTDNRMPRMTGIELVATIKTEFPHIPVVFISGEPLRDTLHYPNGRFVFLQKPFGPKAMLEAVRSVSKPISSASGNG
jgi:CheY-like chemotaxis protein